MSPGPVLKKSGRTTLADLATIADNLKETISLSEI